MVGIKAATEDSDSIITSYRDHCTHIAKGGTLLEVVAECMGRVDGASKGNGGSMHMYNKVRAEAVLPLAQCYTPSRSALHCAEAEAAPALAKSREAPMLAPQLTKSFYGVACYWDCDKPHFVGDFNNCCKPLGCIAAHSGAARVSSSTGLLRGRRPIERRRSCQ